MLADANITIENFNLEDLCQVIRGFMSSKFNAVDDDLLFQTGVFSDSETFTLDFTRQFSIIKRNGDYSHLTQLSMAFEFENTPELAKLSTVLWSMDYNSLDEFFNVVKSNESYIKINQDGVLKNILVNYERV